MKSKVQQKQTSDAHDIGMQISCELSDNTDKAMRIILTQVEATLGESKQADSFKKLVKHEFYRMKDFNQHAVYRILEVENHNFKRSHEPNDELTMPPNEE